MLKKIEITNNQDLPISYVPDVPGLTNGTSFEFEPGVNVIVGPNGVGKSTLMDLINHYCLCSNNMYSAFPNLEQILTIDHLWRFDEETLHQGIIINHDYRTRVFRMCPAREHKFDGDFRDGLAGFANYLTGVHSSCGESTIVSMKSLFRLMFGGNVSLEFPIKEIEKIVNNKIANDYWEPRLNELLNYYSKNRYVVDKPEEQKITLLMDEPDRNLDIDNAEHVLNVLSYSHPQVQLITVIHNPVLIYRLYKQGDVRFIEMAPGYVQKVIDFVEMASK